ncbi:hypothetical protein B296_00011011 [Ensete ventricosum]|uniref:TRAM domain-containing protein n=1 Tax=Ensete ventricosum TaxID=4639 RepID=A0A426ZKQ6_ENSVE|nr:hypothetical protein B296_00011011 [Ensete ventricosum]
MNGSLLRRSPAAMAVAAFPSCGARRLNARPWLHAVRASASSPSPSASPLPPPSEIDALAAPLRSDSAAAVAPTPRSFFPKRGQTLELVCESLAFKGKGVCKVADTAFVVMCDRALPGERFLGRVSRKKGSYAEVVTKLKTITPHWDAVEAPCQYASYCGGCKTQNLSYEAQVRAKEQQVRDLIVHVGSFSDKDPDFAAIFKPFVPCDLQFHYRNKVCVVLAVIQDSWRDPKLGLSPYNVHTHAGFLKHLMLRTGRYDFLRLAISLPSFI